MVLCFRLVIKTMLITHNVLALAEQRLHRVKSICFSLCPHSEQIGCAREVEREHKNAADPN